MTINLYSQNELVTRKIDHPDVIHLLDRLAFYGGVTDTSALNKNSVFHSAFHSFISYYEAIIVDKRVYDNEVHDFCHKLNILIDQCLDSMPDSDIKRAARMELPVSVIEFYETNFRRKIRRKDFKNISNELKKY